MKTESSIKEHLSEITAPSGHLLMEDEVIDILIAWLKADGWCIQEFCKGSQRGIDVLAIRENRTLIIEAKGAKGNPSHGATKKKRFNSGQILTHLGVAIIKVLKEKNNHPEAEIAIAHPDDLFIKNVIESIIPSLKSIGIRFLWVNKNGLVSEG